MKKVIHHRQSCTNVIHSGFDPALSVNSVMPATFHTSTYAFPSAEAGERAFLRALAGDMRGDLIYQRVNNPDAQILADRMIDLEPGAGAAEVFTSGMSAIFTTVLALLPRQKHLVFTTPLYGGTYAFFEEFLGKEMSYKVSGITGNLREAGRLFRKIGKKLGVLFIETPANPTLTLVDIAALAALAKRVNPDCIVVVDNTMLGVFQAQFIVSKHVDIVVYSATKYMGGHSNLTAGVVLVYKGKEELMRKIVSLRIINGTILPPDPAERLLTQIITYRIRMLKQAKAAINVAKFLEGRKEVEKVHFLGLLKPRDFGYAVYRKQCAGPGSVLSFTLRGADKKTAFRFLNCLKLDGTITLAVSMGGVESLAEHPASMTHSEMPPAQQLEYGVTQDMIRLSVGLEDPRDIKLALKAGFAAI